MKKIIFFTAFLLSYTLFAQDTTTIIILHTNDMHAHIDNYAKLKHIKDSLSNIYNDVFLFSAGDIFTGNPKVDRYAPKGFPMIDLMNKVGYDVSELGNHAFDYGQNILKDRIEQAHFPFICSNIRMIDSPLPEPESQIIFHTKNNDTIAILGILQTGKNKLPDAYPPKLKGLQFINPFKILHQYHHDKPHANIHILLSHLGYKTDLKVAGKFSDFDIIIGGHSHTYLPHGTVKKNTLIVQAKSYMRYLGVLTIKLVSHHIISMSDSLINLNKYNNIDSSLQNQINNYNVNPALDKVVTTLSKPIHSVDSLGIFITNAMRHSLHVDIALQNNGGIRIDSLPARITYNQLYQMMPFGNQLVVYHLTQRQLKKLIRYAYNLHFNNEISASGISFKLITNKKGKLTSIKLYDETGNSLPKKIFSVSINDYMASAYQLSFLKKNAKPTGITDVDAVIDFITK